MFRDAFPTVSRSKDLATSRLPYLSAREQKNGAVDCSPVEYYTAARNTLDM